MLPSKDQLTICFAHVAYRLRERFLTLATGIESFEARDGAALEQRIGEADVLVISGLWRNDLLPRAKRLRFIQSIGAGTDQFSCELLKQHGVRLASARGVNTRAVSEHVMALMLALARRLPEARDNQAKRVWRGMIGDITQREDELGGKTLLIVGLGQIGGRLAQLAKAFDMRVIRERISTSYEMYCAPSHSSCRHVGSVGARADCFPHIGSTALIAAAGCPTGNVPAAGTV